MKHWRKLAALVMAGIMIFALAACTQDEPAPSETQAPTETDTAPEDVSTPTGEGDESTSALVSNVDPETFKEFIGTWYADGSSAGYRILIEEDGTWTMSDLDEEVACSGTLRMNEDDECLELYDPDGGLAISLTMQEEGTVHAEILLESLNDSLSTNVFINKITNNISDAPPSDSEDTSNSAPEEDAPATAPEEEAALPNE